MIIIKVFTFTSQNLRICASQSFSLGANAQFSESRPWRYSNWESYRAVLLKTVYLDSGRIEMNKREYNKVVIESG